MSKIKSKLKIIVSLSIMILVALIINIHTVQATDEVVTFTDKVLKDAIIEAGYDTNKDGELSKSEMEAITELNLKAEVGLNTKKVTDITGLETAKNLKKLDLSWNEITNVNALANLTNLHELNLEGIEELEDISALRNLTNLTTLKLYFNNVKDISALANCTNLTELSVAALITKDISPLTSLKNLKKLDLSENSLTNISELAKITSLTELNLSANSITDIRPLANLANLANLTNLNLAYNEISDITPLTSLKNLTSLSLAANNVTDIRALANLTKLTHLNLSSNHAQYKITDISALTKLTNMTELVLYNNKITDITPLKGLKKLTLLDLRMNYIVDFSPISGINIKDLYIAGQNKVEIKKCSISNIANQNYMGKAIKPNLNIKCGKLALKNGTDYTVAYKNNTNLGTATVTITGKGKFTGTITKTFKIVIGQVKNVTAKSQDTKSITVKWSKPSGSITGYEVYMATSKNGKYKKVATITKNSTTTYKKTKLSSGKNYYFKVRAYKTIKNKKNYGAYSAVLETATKTKTPSISKVTAGKKKATIKWKKVSGATGYEVYMSTSKSKGYKKIATNTKNSKVSYTKTSLKSKKKYYFKIRTYKTVAGKKIYSSYSSVKNVKVK